MANKKIAVLLAGHERKYVKTYHDFLRNKLLSAEEKLVFIALKSFVDFSKDTNGILGLGEAYPTMETICLLTSLSRPRATRAINKLVEKRIVKKKRRGLTKSNLYILSDFAAMWSCDNVEDMAEVAQNDGVKPMTAEEHIAALKSMGYDVEIKEKKLVSAPAKAHTQATSNLPTENHSTAVPDCQEEAGRLTAEQEKRLPKKQAEPCQAGSRSAEQTGQVPAETYSMEELKRKYDYDIMVFDRPNDRESIDAMMDVIYRALNTSKSVIRVESEDRPAPEVKERLLNLSNEEIRYALDKYTEQKGRVRNSLSYLLTLLYKCKAQMHMDIQNHIRHTFAGGTEPFIDIYSFTASTGQETDGTAGLAGQQEQQQEQRSTKPAGPEKQKAEKPRTMEQLKEHFGYSSMIAESPHDKAGIDAAMELIFGIIHTDRAVVWISGDMNLAPDVADRLLELSDKEIMLAVRKYRELDGETELLDLLCGDMGGV